METINKKKYELPLFEEDLLRLTFSPEGVVDHPESRDEDISSGTLRIKEMIAESGRTNISVIHEHNNDRVRSYWFEVMDQDKRICRYTRSDQPPWSIYCAVVQFGFHCQTAPRSERKYSFDLLNAGAIELLQRVQQQEYEYSVGWGARVFEKLWGYIRLAALEYQVGSKHMVDVVSTLAEQQGEDAATSIFNNMACVFEKYDIENAFIPHSIRHPSTNALRNNNNAFDDTTERLNSEDQPESENPTWVIVKHRGRGEYNNILFVSIIGSDAIDRFSFHVTDEERGKCVAQNNLIGDLPPYSVIESVQKELEITNIPSFTYERQAVPYSEFLIDLDRLVRRITKEVSPESDLTEAILDEYISSLDVYLSVVAAYEKAPKEFNRGIANSFSKLGISLSAENIGRLSHKHLDQITAVSFQAVDDTDEINKFAQELLAAANTGERRRVDITEDPDVSLAARLLDMDVSMHDS